MYNQTYDGKKIVWKSKIRQILAVVVCFVFVLIGIWGSQSKNWPGLLITIIFFGFGGVVLLIQLLNPKNIFITPGSELSKKIMSNKSEFFSYTDDGFYLTEVPDAIIYRWEDVDAIFGYKRDLITTDEICIDMFFKSGKSLILDESMPGWPKFTEMVSTVFTGITEDSIWNLAHPPFLTNHTLLFDAKGRTFEEAAAHFYKN
ncbi:hypothetical protein [Mucilaginibacter gilvus]|uniref:Uncharacterized protein n=1 Tax=Mucilaginibacter gilvus TaxID=2305909 RepID=A0A444MRL3_9SPHI|nr:hypothetical protein [Mucilaginibacter gilvus]RWY54254.1 hypothetical protein EPL05_09475 [Mucilaginibacter gilvus]